MSEIPKAYEPQAVEARWYQHWLEQRHFVADPARVSDKRPAYSIVIPPPNVTGMLHMGHVLNNTIQDILSRKARMDGKEVLWLPGTDHAGIATQVQVEKALRQEGLTKHDLGREKFLERVWQWKEKHGGIIIQQLKKLGCSCDWTRERFTLDPDYSRGVQKVFVELYKKGLLYRGNRMVNWCPATLTALSDEEVEMEPQKGSLWYFKVEVAEEPGTFLTIATTRPETIPGDTAIAVNPKDPRYTRFIGQHAVRPLPDELPRENKLIPIIADEQVDFKFGTGVLKVTPAHDQADFEIGQRHNLPALDIMNPDASMNDFAGAGLRGLDRFEARRVAAEKLKALGALVKEEPYENKIGFSQRARVPIEPRLSEQWFLKYPSVEPARACVEIGSAGASPAAGGALADGSARPESSADTGVVHSGAADGASAAAPVAGALPDKMRFHPQRWATVYNHWMTNIRDWCISRQLWWGHRIPVWTKKGVFAGADEVFFSVPYPENLKTGIVTLTVPGTNEEIYYRTVNWDKEWKSCDLVALAFSQEGAAYLNRRGFTQDPDVLDTWFSSWLWPFATMGWMGDASQDAKNPTLQTFYPTTDLVTGPDIIFFWVARMIMAGYEFMGDMPFRNVYFTGIIRDKQGRKMSKSLGNSPDPLELIAQYGADALRFGTMRSAPLGLDVLFDEKDVELGRNFCNKLWNACRFRQMQASAGPEPNAHEVEGEINPALLTPDDQWILLKLDQAIREINVAFAEYRFNEVTQTLYRFFWSEYCDWYVEASKAAFSNAERGTRGADRHAVRANKLAVIDFVLSHTLRLFHPFLPFITEELWHGLGYNQDLPAEQGGRTIMTARWPQPLDEHFRQHYGLEDAVRKFVDAKYELVTRGRNLRREFDIPANKKVPFILKVKDPLPGQEAEVIRLLLNAEVLDVDPNFAASKGTPSVLTGLGELFLPREGVGDLEAEKTRLKKELARSEGEIAKVQAKLNNPDFVNKVPPNVLEEHKKRLGDWQAKQQQVRSALEKLGE